MNASNTGKRAVWMTSLGATAIAALLAAHCGGGGGGSGSARINGNVSEGPSAALGEGRGSWLVWLGEEVLGLARRAFAQGAGSVDGIRVAVVRGGNQVSGLTDESGEFDLGGAPTGDVMVVFSRDDCVSEGELDDVVANSTITLEDVDATDCGGNATAGLISESFVAVVRNKPGSANGNLNVCINSGGRIRTRTVKIKDASFEDGGSGRGSFAELEEGDRIEAIGEREGLGAPSALDASVVRIISSGSPGDCESLPEPTATAEPTTTPQPTATPEP